MPAIAAARGAFSALRVTISGVSGMTVLSLPVTFGYLRKIGKIGEKYSPFILQRGSSHIDDTLQLPLQREYEDIEKRSIHSWVDSGKRVPRSPIR